MTENAENGKGKPDEQKAQAPPITTHEDPAQTPPVAGVDEGIITEQPPSEVERLRAELAKREEDYKALYAQLQRTAADFDNYRKRSLRDQDEARRMAGELVIVSILEPIENLSRALHASSGTRSVKELRKGLQMIEKQAWCALEANGLKKIEAAGKPFDHSLHEAVEQVEGDEDDKVKEVVQAGYTLNGKVLRCAKVKVVKKKEVK
ncbi:MAG: nucleotide exchange factor GrpE [Euryarchaeota archaeon]|nr:nucleotide exchange factor GrpE [Euryarchaeota archaeon]